MMSHDHETSSSWPPPCMGYSSILDQRRNSLFQSYLVTKKILKKPTKRHKTGAEAIVAAARMAARAYFFPSLKVKKS